MLEATGSTGFVKINNEYINPTTIAKIKKDTKDRGSIVTYTTETILGDLPVDYRKRLNHVEKDLHITYGYDDLTHLKVPEVRHYYVEPEVLANAANTAMREGRIVDVMA